MNNLSTLMRSRVESEHLDLAALASGSIRQGRRIRRVRYAGAGLATAAVIAGAAVGAASLPGATTATSELQPAAGSTFAGPGVPANAPLQAGQTLRVGHGVTATVVACAAGKPDPIGGNPACILPAAYTIEGSSTIRGTGTGFAVVLTGTTHAVDSFWSNGFQSPLLDTHKGLTYALPAGSPLVQAVYQGQAVSIHLAGWSQVGEVRDDKQSLKGPGGAVADIVWRPASDRTAWTLDSGTGARASTWTSPIHDGVFVTIQGGRGTTNADIQALGRSLTWR